MADFNTKEKKPIIDIIFLAIFFAFLFVPMSKIDQSEKSKYENRFLKAYKPLINKSGEINFNFGNDFNEWFSDRFNFRITFVKMRTWLDYKLSKKIYKDNHSVVDKTNGILYHNSIDFGYTNTVNAEILKKYKNILNNLEKYIGDNNTKIYFLIVPRKYDYFEHTNNDFVLMQDNIVQVIDYLNKETNIDFLYLKDSFDSLNKENPVFFKTDPHWTNTGIYCAYLALLQKENIIDNNEPFRKNSFYDYRVIYAYDRKRLNFSVGNIAIDAFKTNVADKNLKNKYLNINYLYFANKNPFFVKKINSGENYFNQNALTNKKVLILGNSFSLGIVLLAPYIYKDVKRQDIRKRENKTPYITMKKEKYDAIIFCINSAFFDSAMEHLNLFLKDSGEKNDI